MPRGTRNISDNFEEMYLRFDTSKKCLEKVDYSKLNEAEIDKCVNYMTNYFFSNNKKLLLYNGYDRDDLESIVRFFAYTFFGFEVKCETDRDKYTLMFRYINQKICHFLSLVKRKFQVDEVSLWSEFTESIGDTTLVVSNQSQFQKTVSLKDEIEELIDKLEDYEALILDQNKKRKQLNELKKIHKAEIYQKNFLFDELKTPNVFLKQCDKDIGTLEDQINLLSINLNSYTNNIKERKILKQKLAKLKKQLKRQGSQQKTTQKLKNRMEQEWSNNIDLLVYYTSSKHISAPVRKAAIKYCKRYSIDYKLLILDLIEKNNYDASEFVINK